MLDRTVPANWHVAAWWPADAAAWKRLRQDLVAGLTVAAISLPQGMAYAILAGVDPRYGLYSAMVVTAVASLFGSSSHLINGPTSAISLVVFGALAMFGADRAEAAQAMFLLAVMVGLIQIAIALLRLGDLTRYISESVILGFITAASLLLGIAQIGNALGLKEKGTGAQHVFVRLWLTLTSGEVPSFATLTVTISTLALAIGLRNIVRRYRLPQFDMLIALVAVAVAAYLLGWTTPDHAGKTAIRIAGEVPAALPGFHLPRFELSRVSDLAGDAFAIALLGILEALSIAKAIADETRQHLNANRQILAEGLANFVGGFFRCLPGSGSLSRSAINHQSGAQTRFSGIAAACFVAIALVSLAPLARYVPKAALAALLLLTAARLIDVKRLVYTARASRTDAAVMIATALSALALGLDASIGVGVALSLLLFMPRAARLQAAELVVDGDVVRARRDGDPPARDYLVFDLEGELFFGAAPELERIFSDISERMRRDEVKTVLLRLKRVRNPDVVSLEHLDRFLEDDDKEGREVWLAGVRPDLLAAMRRVGFFDWFPQERVFAHGRNDYSATLAAIRAIEARKPQAQPRGELVYVI